MTFKRSLILASVFGMVAMAVSAQQPVVVGQSTQSGVEFTPYFTTGWPNAHGMSPEEFELSRQSETLIKQLGKAEGQDKEKIKTKLNETIDKQFDLRQKRHEAEITALETQLKKLKDMVQKRQENRKEIVGKRYDQLLRESEGLGW